jgi:hypothetical protein
MLIVAVAAVLYVTAFGLVPPTDQVRATLDPADIQPSAQPSVGPSADRALIQGEIGQVEPTPSSTPQDPIVNGRVQPAPVDPPQAGEGKYAVAPGGTAPPAGSAGTVVRYVVEVERGLPFDPAEFAAAVHTILNDRRSWGHDGRMQFARVADGSVDIRVALSSADLTDDQCAPLRTLGKVSCWNGTRAVINAERWGTGAETYGADVLSYREYVINHEVGHAFGYGHVGCPGSGEPAPVMVQQTKSLEGCKPNPWPFP